MKQLAQVCNEMLAEAWARDNIAKQVAGRQTKGISSCLREVTGLATTSIECPTTIQLSGSMTWSSLRASAISRFAARHGVNS